MFNIKVVLAWQAVALLNLPQAQVRYQSEQADSIEPQCQRLMGKMWVHMEQILPEFTYWTFAKIL